ncbi:MAG: hypothetical protein ACK4SY_07255 [Pyrobaculum sp.]
MAILLYAMIKAYDTYIAGREREVWLLVFYIWFDGHAAVMTADGGKIAILDPAGRYYTGMPGRLTYAPIAEGLLHYATHWLNLINNVILYKVEDGKLVKVFSGDLWGAIIFLGEGR